MELNIESLEQSSLSLEQSSQSLEQSRLSLEQSSLSLEQSRLSLEQSSRSLEQSSLSLEQSSLLVSCRQRLVLSSWNYSEEHTSFLLPEMFPFLQHCCSVLFVFGFEILLQTLISIENKPDRSGMCSDLYRIFR